MKRFCSTEHFWSDSKTTKSCTANTEQIEPIVLRHLHSTDMSQHCNKLICIWRSMAICNATVSCHEYSQIVPAGFRMISSYYVNNHRFCTSVKPFKAQKNNSWQQHNGVNFLIKVAGSYCERGARAYITRVWGQSPQLSQGVEPLVKESSILSFRSTKDVQICPILLICKLMKYTFYVDMSP